MKAWIGALGVIVGASLSACSAGSTAVVDSDSAALTLATTTPATSLDFTTVGGAAIPAALMSNVYETLVRISPEGEIVPGLADSWEVESTRYTFHPVSYTHLTLPTTARRCRSRWSPYH